MLSTRVVLGSTLAASLSMVASGGARDWPEDPDLARAIEGPISIPDEEAVPGTADPGFIAMVDPPMAERDVRPDSHRTFARSRPTTVDPAGPEDGQVLAGNGDGDADGVPNEDDACPGTRVPEQALALSATGFVLRSRDGVFDTASGTPGARYTLTSTGGCSCQQIVEALGLLPDELQDGCSASTMERWIAGL